MRKCLPVLAITLLLCACGEDHFERWDRSVTLCRDVIHPYASGEYEVVDEKELQADCECAISSVSGGMSDQDFAEWAEAFEEAAEQIQDSGAPDKDHAPVIADWTSSFGKCL